MTLYPAEDGKQQTSGNKYVYFAIFVLNYMLPPSPLDQVMSMMERVQEAQRIAAMEMREESRDKQYKQSFKGREGAKGKGKPLRRNK